ncbi:hypothetical protein C1X05_05235 [Laceyella sacchari]|uniref:hypothetical protein n=1 Tax=Laceyella tengchongensis TaxID=574699 RepID=UPI000C9F9DFA|nr:hypothetical protein C1X05_05235 [Laceyella sacchari]MRG26854.1 hypothetical protein [Laceyella tengchongensis]
MIIKQLGAQHISKASILLTHSFIKNEPMAAFLRIPEDAFYRYCYLTLVKAVEQQMSFVAIEGEHLAAVVLGRKATVPFLKKEEIKKVCPELDPIITLFEEIEKKATSCLGPDTLVLDMGASHSDFTGQGLVQQLEKRVVEQGQSQGYNKVAMICTNEASKHIFRKLFPATVASGISYKEFVYQGQAVFSEIEQDTSCELLFAKLDDVQK